MWNYYVVCLVSFWHFFYLVKIYLKLVLINYRFFSLVSNSMTEKLCHLKAFCLNCTHTNCTKCTLYCSFYRTSKTCDGMLIIFVLIYTQKFCFTKGRDITNPRWLNLKWPETFSFRTLINRVSILNCKNEIIKIPIERFLLENQTLLK